LPQGQEEQMGSCWDTVAGYSDYTRTEEAAAGIGESELCVEGRFAEVEGLLEAKKRVVPPFEVDSGAVGNPVAIWC